LDGSVALQILQETHGLHSLRAACEDKVAEDFETCSKHPDFLKLSANQLARILRRRDLVVSRKEAVVKAIFSWIKVS
jgi:ABC-type metal ion transport system substrate-binding protein